MKKHLRTLFTCIVLATAAKAGAQCSTTNAPQQTVMSGQTAQITMNNPFVIHICSNAVAYDTLGSSGHEYHIDSGGQLHIRMNSTTTVYLKSGAYVNHYNDPGTLIYWAEPGATVLNVTGPPYPPCSTVSFPSSVCTTLGVTEQTAAAGITAFPNPADANVQLVNNATTASELQLTDVTGRMITATVIPANTTAVLDVSAIPAGIYFLVTRLNGEVVKQEKLVISH
jgi:hypothetical protein